MGIPHSGGWGRVAGLASHEPPGWFRLGLAIRSSRLDPTHRPVFRFVLDCAIIGHRGCSPYLRWRIMMAKPFGDPYERFPTTHWSLVARAGMDRAEARRDALGRLLTRYLPALCAHLIRQQGMSAADADDAVQQFVADKILQRDLIGQADAERGKFRTFLLTSLKRFVANRRRDEAAKKRAPDAGDVLPLGDRAGDVVSENRAADVFDVQWAREVLSLTLTRMQQRCHGSDRDDVWSVFHCRLVQPLLEGTQPPDYETIVERFGLKSPAQASNVLITAKRMFARALRATVGEYTQDPAEIEAEIDQLQRILSGR